MIRGLGTALILMAEIETRRGCNVEVSRNPGVRRFTQDYDGGSRRPAVVALKPR